MKVNDSIGLGDKVKDRFSPYTGYVHGVAAYITGCTQFLVRPRTLGEDGKPKDGVWLDETAVVKECDGEPVELGVPRGGPSAADAAVLKI